MSEETKKRMPIWIYPSTLKGVDAAYKSDNCESKSEFIEKAVKFYLGYLKQEDNINYLAPVISSMMDASIKGCDEHLSKLLFKIAVELAKLTHLLASINELDDETLRKLHVKCLDEVRKTNGIIRYENAVQYQRSDFI
jgi:metal-responsive CopG/Arc/MetJ family transcriptional regulator